MHIRKRLAAVSALLTLLVLATAFRLPVLVNAAAVTSDGAIVGLQTLHMQKGEWSWLLWGTNYQAPSDSALALVAFALLGPTPLALSLVPFVLQLVNVALYFAILRARFRPWMAALLALPVVLTPMAVNLTLLYVQRQVCFTVFTFAIWLLAGAHGSKHPSVRLALGGWLAILTFALDTYSVQWIVPLVALAFCCAWRPPGARKRLRIRATALGVLAGIVCVAWFRTRGPAHHGHLPIALDDVPRNWKLLVGQTLPWTLSYKIFAHQTTVYAEPYAVPIWFRVVQIVSVVALVVAVVRGVRLWRDRRVPWLVRALAVFGGITMCASLCGYLVSGMPVDMWSTRYLAPLVLMMPFALAPLAYVMKLRSFAFVVAPYLVCAAVNGWISYGVMYVDHGRPVRSARGTGREELEVAQLLRNHHVAYAAAQYWLSYRLTFLFLEDPIVVPLAPGDDRYPPYREAFDAARDVAYLFHPSESRAKPEDTELELKSREADYETFKIADFTIFIEHRH